MEAARRLRVLVVDDEPPARRKVRRMLRAQPDIDVVGEAGSGPEAVDAILAHQPDLVFLDVRMPGLDGFGVLEVLGGEDALPHVVFVTAYDEYALRAFDVHAVDYLLKPFDEVRFERALGRARERVAARGERRLEERVRRLLEEVRPRGVRLERILVKAGGRSHFIKVDEIDWIEAARNYVYVHARGERHLVRTPITRLEEQLDPSRFVRIHRTAIVNLDSIRELRPWSHGDQQVVLRDGTRLVLSRRYRKRLPPHLAEQL